MSGAVAGCIHGEVERAVPVAAASLLWWEGAELLDDLIDGADPALSLGFGHSDGEHQPSEITRSELMITAITLLTLVPASLVAALPVAAQVRGRLTDELTGASVEAAEGQLADLYRGPDDLSWARVMVTYGAKTGAAYGRDAAMVAILAGLDEQVVAAWRAFGRIFGVLFQLSNDNHGLHSGGSEDLSNATPTLLLAYAANSLEPQRRHTLLRLRSESVSDASARAELRQLLCSPEVRSGYVERVRVLLLKARALLEQLAQPSQHRDVLSNWLGSAAWSASVEPDGEGGRP
ncbi:MAG: polyprenyl synthase [Frankiales bacterium]|nr:polyprenyl synthase [Frankiales bacterium]